MIGILVTWVAAFVVAVLYGNRPLWGPVALVAVFVILLAVSYVQWFRERAAAIELEKTKRRLAMWTDPMTPAQKDAVVDVIFELSAHPGPKGERIRQHLDSLAPWLRRWDVPPKSVNLEAGLTPHAP